MSATTERVELATATQDGLMGFSDMFLLGSIVSLFAGLLLTISLGYDFYIRSPDSRIPKGVGETLAIIIWVAGLVLMACGS